MTFTYWLKFDKDPRPERVVARTWEELNELVTQLVYQRGPYEWMIRDYTR